MNDLETLARDICISMVGGIHTEVVAALLPYLREAHAAGQRAGIEAAAGVCEQAGRTAGKVEAITALFDAAKAIRALEVTP